MLALISDIHGNLEALNAVTSRIGNTKIVCLGDVVCYGPDSIECVRRSADWESVVAGPLDLALLDHDSTQWSPTLNGYIESLRKRIDQSFDSDFLVRTLETYRAEFVQDGLCYFHGAPGNIRDWIFPEDIYCPAKLDRLADQSEHAFIGGGSHLPGIFRRGSRDWEFIQPENGKSYDLPKDGKTIITLGSVGQPRDADPRAAFAILDDTSIVFHRVEYDMETTRKKISDDPDIDGMHGERLPVGR